MQLDKETGTESECRSRKTEAARYSLQDGEEKTDSARGRRRSNVVTILAADDGAGRMAGKAPTKSLLTCQSALPPGQAGSSASPRDLRSTCPWRRCRTAGNGVKEILSTGDEALREVVIAYASIYVACHAFLIRTWHQQRARHRATS